MQIKFISFFTFVVLALANEHPMISSLNEIRHVIRDLTAKFDEWEGDTMPVPSIAKRSNDIFNVLQKAASLKSSKIEPVPADMVVSRQVVDVAQRLAREVEAAVDSGIKSKSKINSFPIIGKLFTKFMIRRIHKAALDVAQSIEPQIADEFKADAHAVIRSIDEDLTRGMAAMG